MLEVCNRNSPNTVSYNFLIMTKKGSWKVLSLHGIAEWLSIFWLSAVHYQTYVDGSLFSKPVFNDQEKRSQVNAQTWCNRNRSKLLEITSDDIQSLAVQFLNDAINHNQLTGNPIITNGKRFNLEKFIWVNGGTKGSDLTVNNQDLGYSNSYGYLNSIQSGFQIVADAPRVKRNYICEGSYLCADGFKMKERCYKCYNETLSWYDARNRCTSGGGDLASFDFIAENRGLSALNGSGWNPTSTYWIGIRRQKWTWQGSDLDISYSQWSEGHPYYPDNIYNECLCLQPYDWKWIECDCNQAYQFVCMTGTTSTLKPASMTSGSMVNEITLGSVTASATTTQAINSPSSISNFVNKSTAAFSSSSSSVYIGVGVGIGGSILIAVIIVIVIVTIRRKGCYRKAGFKKQSDPPDVTPESYYAKVVKNTEYDNITEFISEQIPPPAEYADLYIVAATQSSNDREQLSLSLVQPRAATLLAPSRDRNEPVHFVVNDVTYAVVQQN